MTLANINYSPAEFEIEFAVFGQELSADLYRLEADGPGNLIDEVTISPRSVNPIDQVTQIINTIRRIVADWCRDQGWDDAPDAIIQFGPIYQLPYNRPTYRVAVKVSYDYLELLSDQRR